MHLLSTYILQAGETSQISVYPDAAWILLARAGYFRLSVKDEEEEIFLSGQIAVFYFTTEKHLQICAGNENGQSYEVAAAKILTDDLVIYSFYEDIFQQLTVKPLFEILTPAIPYKQFMNKMELSSAEMTVVLDSLLSRIGGERDSIQRSFFLDENEESIFLIAEKMILEMDGDWTLEKIVRGNHSNYRKIEEQFKKYLGMPAAQFKTFVRIQKAKILLQETNLPINHISMQVGFAHPAHFSKIFRQKTGFTPSDLRNRSLIFDQKLPDAPG